MVPNHQIGFVAIFLIELTTNRSKPKARLKIFLGSTCRKEATCVPTFSSTVSNWFTGRLLSSLPFFSFLSSFCLRFVPFLLRFALCAKLSTFDIENSTVERDRCFLSKLLLFLSELCLFCCLRIIDESLSTVRYSWSLLFSSLSNIWLI